MSRQRLLVVVVGSDDDRTSAFNHICKNYDAFGVRLSDAPPECRSAKTAPSMLVDFACNQLRKRDEPILVVEGVSDMEISHHLSYLICFTERERMKYVLCSIEKGCLSLPDLDASIQQHTPEETPLRQKTA